MFSSGKSSVTIASIRCLVSEPDIVAHYIGVDTFPSLINSPLRNDSNPSFSLSMTDDSLIYYRDFATHETGNLYSLLSHMWGLSFQDTLERIFNDIPSIKKTQVSRTVSGRHITRRENFKFDVVLRKWNDNDDAYWKSFGINREWLEFADIYPVSRKLIYKDNAKYVFGVDRLAYVYVERKDGNITYKLYQPLNKENKWMSTVDKSVWSLWTKLPEKGNNVIIASSLKDCLTIWANTGIPCTCMQGEGYIPKENVIEELKSRFRNVIVFYDNDFRKEGNPGRTDALNLCKRFGLQRIELPEKYNEKDPSDFFRHYGKEKFLKVMKEMLARRERHDKQEDNKC